MKVKDNSIAYKSLNFDSKIYQIKAYRYIKKVLKKGQSFLELGCADGSFASWVGQQTKSHPYGLDLSMASVKEAKKLGVNVRVHDLSKRFPFKDETFDMVIGLEVIEHLLDNESFVGEIQRVLKKKGYVVLSTPNLASFTNRLRLLFGKYPRFLSTTWKTHDYHAHLYTPELMRNQLQQAGFNIIIFSSPNFFNPIITKPYCPQVIKQLSMKLGDIFPTIGSHMVLLAQKTR